MAVPLLVILHWSPGTTGAYEGRVISHFLQNQREERFQVNTNNQTIFMDGTWAACLGTAQETALR